jgi:hypothetical protein
MITTKGAAQSYTLVFLSRSPTTFDNVLVHLVVDNQADFVQTYAFPLILIVCGLALVLFGATRRKKTVIEPVEEK